MGETKAREDCDFDSPWDTFADEEEPWKDFERLLKLEEQMDYQYEIADALGTSPSTISYWLEKAHDEYQPEPDDEDLKCVYFDVCGNEVVAQSNAVCGVCLDLARRADFDGLGRGALIEDDDPDPETRMEALYDHYEEFANTREQQYSSTPEANDEDEVPDCDECGGEMTLVDDLGKYVCEECRATRES